ncbi:type III secretion protein U [Paramixta manurensis]|uniref:Type III secretion protein U n=1 Tax=Paramixta manurensis TaxID=2740817 RepID=A0A6M8ULP3_9GAMM|nr:type III secretion protein U [Erwiniaceae bacterium PD-1]
MGEKTEKATPQKLQEARKKGQISQSQDIPKLLVMLGVLETVFALMDDSMGKLEALMSLPLGRLDRPFTEALGEIGGAALLTLSVFFLLTVGIIILLRILGGWIQFGPLFATEALAPKFEALNPLGKFKEMFSARQFVQILNSLLKAIVLGLVFWMLIEPRLPLLASMSDGTLVDFWHGAAAILKTLAHTIIGVLLVFSVADFALQKYFYLKQNRMSHEDIKNEYKQNEGDPHTKGHRRHLARELVNSPPKKVTPQQVEKADVLLVNPTHFAVGLFYQPDETPLPVLLFKAEDADAQELIALAHKANIPVVRYIWLTRTLYRTTDEGAYIPRETLKAVAQIYRLLRSLEDRLRGELIEFEE